ncbi:MAG TPA: 16S rRNA (guanine(966)-N(2))-methyltransferase RsmD [Bacteroidota bacterium]|nr:16S rRNA (guanine(966)-N(2))-methyltransferase RsmD [Bacteroidota bacterium]
MRVIAGVYRGRTLLTVKDLSVRPATDRVRQTLFDMLANRVILEGARVLDLFAGSGSLGIEAISRGAAHVTFIENARDAVEFIERNLRTLGCAETADILEMDAMSYLRQSREAFDIVFADPPYADAETEEIPGLAFGNGLVRRGGYLLIEHSDAVAFASTQHFTVGPVKKFGRTRVTFFQPTNGKPV